MGIKLPGPVDRFRKWVGIEEYAVWPMVSCLLTNCAVYYICRIIAAGKYHHDISIGLDGQIPCIPSMFSWLYCAAFIFWAISYVNYANLGKRYAQRIAFADFIGKFICALFFAFYPTIMSEPPVVVTDYWSFMLFLMKLIDEPNNLFPSLHVLVSWISWRYVARMSTVSDRYKSLSFMCVLIVFLAILFTKQHLILDIFGGVIVAEIGIFISDKLVFKDSEGIEAKDNGNNEKIFV